MPEPIPRSRRAAFSLIELLVIIGIITILLALLFPPLSQSWAASRMVNCASNMRQLGQALFMYAHDNHGSLIPVDNDPTAEGGVRGFGTLRPPRERWPVLVFKFPLPNPETDVPEDYCPKVLICPADNEPAMGHTYALNNPVAAHHCKEGSTDFNGVPHTDVVLAAEKITAANDYYLEPNEGDFDSALDLFRHGTKRGSNYLFFDGHVNRAVPGDIRRGMDPWSTRAP